MPRQLELGEVIRISQDLRDAEKANLHFNAELSRLRGLTDLSDDAIREVISKYRAGDWPIRI